MIRKSKFDNKIMSDINKMWFCVYLGENRFIISNNLDTVDTYNLDTGSWIRFRDGEKTLEGVIVGSSHSRSFLENLIHNNEMDEELPCQKTSYYVNKPSPAITLHDENRNDNIYTRNVVVIKRNEEVVKPSTHKYDNTSLNHTTETTQRPTRRPLKKTCKQILNDWRTSSSSNEAPQKRNIYENKKAIVQDKTAQEGQTDTMSQVINENHLRIQRDEQEAIPLHMRRPCNRTSLSEISNNDLNLPAHTTKTFNSKDKTVVINEEELMIWTNILDSLLEMTSIIKKNHFKNPIPSLQSNFVSFISSDKNPNQVSNDFAASFNEHNIINNASVTLQEANEEANYKSKSASEESTRTEDEFLITNRNMRVSTVTENNDLYTNRNLSESTTIENNDFISNRNLQESARTDNDDLITKNNQGDSSSTDDLVSKRILRSKIKAKKKLSENNKNLQQWVPIGSGETKVHIDAYKKVNWTTYRTATRTLLVAVFSREVLANHSLTGKASPAFQSRTPKEGLNKTSVNDVILEVKSMFEVDESILRQIITTKCADECKMSNMSKKVKGVRRTKELVLHEAEGGTSQHHEVTDYSPLEHSVQSQNLSNNNSVSQTVELNKDE